MRIVQLKQKLPIDNLDAKVGCGHEGKSLKKHGPLLPSSIRGIIIGPSNCGKTNVMISLPNHPSGLRFENVYIYLKSLYESKYKHLRKILSPIKKDLGYYAFSDAYNIVEPSDAKPV